MYRNPYGANAYNQASQNVSGLKAVIMLFEGMIRLINEAKRADQDKRFEDRYKATEKASRVLLGLQGQLDFEKGGEIAPMLDSLYDTLFNRMMQINSRNSQAVADDVIKSLMEMKKTWEGVREQVEGVPAPGAATGASAQPAVPPTQPMPTGQTATGVTQQRPQPQQGGYGASRPLGGGYPPTGSKFSV